MFYELYIFFIGKTPTECFDTVFEECGGVLNVTSCGSVPRNKKQVSNIKSTLKPKCTERDPLFAVIEQCKQEESQVQPFIRNVQGAPDAMCVLASDNQLHDVARFCCDPKLFSIFGIDPTFNLGEFSVTVTTYRHLQLLDRHTKKPPVFLGPMLIHQRKTAQSYHFLASSMVGLHPEVASIQAIGTDGEKQLGEGFKLQFRSCTHLLCFIHMKDCIVRKLRDIGICGASGKPFLDEIFGVQEGTHRFTGLVDSGSPSDFDERLHRLESEWNKREREIRSSDTPLFYAWFTKYHSTDFKEHMLKPERIKAGLGDPPAVYTNNANESANARIKAKVNYQKSDLKVFCNEMKSLVERQFRDVERAFTLDTGPYEVAPNYLPHKENATKWVKRSAQYKQRVLTSLYKMPLVYPMPNDSIPACTALDCENEDGGECSTQTVPLSISWQDAELSGEIYAGMWTKASQLIAQTNSVTPAPGLESSRMVSSFSNPRKPHLVTSYKNGKVTCDCQNCSVKHVCAHILATAETMGILENFIEWFKKENDQTNLWKLSRSSGVPKNPGSKPTSRKRSRNVLPQVKTTSDKLCKLDSAPSNPSPSQTQPLPDNVNHWYPPFPSPHYPYYGMGRCPPYHYPSYFQYSSPSQHQPTSFHPATIHDQHNFEPGTSSFTPIPGPGSSSQPGTPTTSLQQNRFQALDTVYKPSTTAHLFTLKKMSARIKKCQGCKKQFHDTAPSTLVVSRLECRPFVSPDGSVKVPKTPKNSHYHLHMECLSSADPSFQPHQLCLPTDMRLALSESEIDSLTKFGVQIS